MNELMVFNSTEFGQMRSMERNGEPWFVAADVCRALDIANTTDALTRLDEDEKARFNLGLPGGNTNCVSEPGLYALVLGSRKPEAKAFKRWITHEVVPCIRKHGLYATDQAIEAMLSDPDTAIRMLQDLKEKRAKIKEMEDKMEADRPKVLFADAVTASKNSILVGEMAKLLKQNGVEIGQNRLFEWLRSNGYLIRRQGSDYNMPTQRSMEMGLFEIKETAITHSDGHTSVNKTPKVTGKGQAFFVNTFLGHIEDYLPNVLLQR